MKGIYIAAIITTALSLTIVGSIILRKTPRKEWSLLIVVLLLQIPMCAIAFYFIRLPLDRWLQGLLRQCSGTYSSHGNGHWFGFHFIFWPWLHYLLISLKARTLKK